MRSGDTVRHRPTGETWLVAYVDGLDLAWCGWPEGMALAADCDIVRVCTDAEHERALREWTTPMRTRESGGYDLRSTVCARQLDELLARKSVST